MAYYPFDGDFTDASGNVEVFYDNASLGTIAIATNFDITSVGQGFNAPLQSMNGQIDELYIYNEAIDSAKINELFGSTSGPRRDAADPGSRRYFRQPQRGTGR